MVSVIINNVVSEVSLGSSILEACRGVGIKVPRFCYHETLSIAGNCRMCLVEIEGLEKAVASCLTEVSDGMVIYTESLFAQKARESVLEELLINHPLDCPICDQAGECDLQDQAKKYGVGNSKFYVKKRGVEDKLFGPLVKTIMTRCIHCTRCVRFGTEVAGVNFLGTFNRGGSTEIGSYISNFFNSEISGNVIDLCPVGALTSKSFKFKGRPWEMRISDSVDMTDSLGSNIYVNFKGRQIFRVLPKSNININDQIISDKARFSYDGNHKNRVLKIIKKNTSNEHVKFNWSNLIGSKMSYKFFKNTHFIINPDIGLETIHELHSCSFKYFKLKISCLKSNIENENLYLWAFLDKINDIHSCNSIGLIYSLNPKIECALLNTKLRIRVQNSLLTLSSLTGYYFSDVQVRFSNLTLAKSLNLFEGKILDLSKTFLSSISPLLLTSNFFSKRGVNLINLFSFLKFITKSIKIIKTSEAINFETVDFLNIKPLNKRNLKIINKQALINVEDIFLLRKTLLNAKKINLSLSTHHNGLTANSTILLPSLSHFEDERILLNLEQRPMKTNKTYSSYYDARSIKNTLNSLLIIEKTYCLKHFSFLYKIIRNPHFFNKNYKYFISLGKPLENYFKKNKIMKYPFKSNLIDFYCSNKITKNSSNMIRSSIALRSTISSFKDLTSI